MAEGIRWGILGTAHIVEASFLPALREADGTAAVVGSREARRAETFARRNGIERGVGTYEAVLEDPSIQAVYIPLPNSLHVPWAKRAIEAGKAVLAEKPLGVSEAEVRELCDFARARKALLWEAFVFPFQPQFERLQELLAFGAIGELREIESSFHFQSRSRADIRFDAELGGGALMDVGCYPIHLANLLFREGPVEAWARASWAAEGVDEAVRGCLAYPSGGMLQFSCGMTGPYDTFTRIIGSKGEMRLTNPFHPGEEDTLKIRADRHVRRESLSEGEPSFTPALRHIQEVLSGEERPRHLATEDALVTADAIQRVRESIGEGAEQPG